MCADMCTLWLYALHVHHSGDWQHRKSFHFFPQTASQEDCLWVDRKMSCYLCYLNGSPWAPRNWLWRQCGLRVHRINGGSWRGASLNHTYGLPMESDYGTSADLSISRAGPSLSEKLHLPWATQTHKSEQAWGVPSTQSLGGTQRTSLWRVGSVYQCHSHGTRALRNPMMERFRTRKSTRVMTFKGLLQ